MIETALREVDQLSVIIYDVPDITPIPLTVRANWLHTLYPQVNVIEAWDGPTEVGDTPEIRRAHEDYIIRRLAILGISHFYSSEFYGNHMSCALGAVNRTVDVDRKHIPISATDIRANPYQHREFVHPVDVIGIGLYYSRDVRFISLLYVVLLVIAINGLWTWHRHSTEPALTTATA